MKTHWLLPLTLTFLSHFGPAWAGPSLTLSEFLKAVQAQSPDLQIEKSNQAEAQARSKGIRLAPPMVGYMNMQEEGRSNPGIEISQELPFPTKILKEKEVRKLESKAQEQESEYRKNEIILNARKAYFDYWQVFEKSQIIKEKRDWLKSHSRIVRSTARSDSAAQAHLLEIESEADMMENELLEIQALLVEKKNALQKLAPQLEKDWTPQAPKLEPLIVESKSDLVQNNPLLQVKKSELASAEATRSLANQAYLPDFFLRYRKFNGNEMAPRNEEMMIGISVPFLFFWQPQSEKSESNARFQRVQSELQKVQIEIESQISTLIEKNKALLNQLNNLNEKLIPRAHKRMKLIDNLSQRTMENLDQHRAVMLDSLDLRLKVLEVRTEYENTSADLLLLLNREAAQ